MDVPATSSLERRKQVRVRVRPDLRIEPEKFEGRTCYVVKDPVSLRYYRFRKREYTLLRLLDGRHTLHDVQQQFERQSRPDRLRLEEVEGFARLLLAEGLACTDAGDARLRPRPATGRWAPASFLYWRIPLFDPDRLLARLLVPLRWIFTPWFLLLSSTVIVGAILLFAIHVDAFLARLPSARDFFTPQTAFYLWLTLGLVKVIHEFGHGLSCKAFGGECHEMGFLVLCLSPALYCNVSDAWTLPSKWKRIIISFAGIYVELIIAALATFVWWNTPGQPFLNNLALSLMVVCSISTVVFNGNPLMRYDGYYVLADWLEIPNLRDRAMRTVRRLLLRLCLGIEGPVESSVAAWRRVLFVAYALASGAYRWVVAYAVCWFLYGFLRPYRLGAVGGLLAAAAAVVMFGAPWARLLRELFQQRRWPAMKPLRVCASAAVVGAVLAAFVMLPLPVGQVCRAGLVELQPDAMERVFVPVVAVLEGLHVRDGQAVGEGEILAEFRSLELEDRREEAQSERDVRAVELEALRDQAGRSSDAGEQARLAVEIAAAAGEYDLYARQAEMYDAMIKRLTLRAPRAGVVMAVPRIEEVGKQWLPGGDRPFCVIGDPKRLRVQVPLPPADYRLLREELARGTEPPVAVHVQGMGTRRWPGKLAALPEAEAPDLPLPLTSRGGGAVPVSADRGGALVPRAQQYLVTADILEPDAGMMPGARARVRIECRWRPLAWWLWRAVASTFDLGLM